MIAIDICTASSGGSKSVYRHWHHASWQPSLAAAVMCYILVSVTLLEQTQNSNSRFLASAFRFAPIGSATRRSTIGIRPNTKASSGLFLDTSGEHSGGNNSRSFENPERVPPVPLVPQSYPSTGSMPVPQAATVSPPRNIRVERMVRLPVWPVWAGVIDFFVGWIFGPEAGSKLEQYVLGGRVCPMQLDGTSTSPFLLLVHHHHNFWKWDAIFRKISAFVLPEGFPAHPHRGFTTLTYFLPDEDRLGGGGGFVHRDSIGVKQTYGSGGSYKHQAQWLFTGRGMLHEEMFDFLQNDLGQEKPDYNSRYELYQLWVNVPGVHKLDPPRVQLLRGAQGDGDEGSDVMPFVSRTKTIVSSVTGERLTTSSGVVVIAGTYRPHEPLNSESVEFFESQAAPLHSDMSILHVTVEETAKTTGNTPTTTTPNKDGSSSPGWIYDIPRDHDTLIVYVRKGSCTMETTTVLSDGTTSSRSPPTEAPIHSTVFLEKGPALGTPTREQLIVTPSELDVPLDLLVLSGRPIYRSDYNVVEPVAMQGSMVMNNNAQIEQAYTDYQYGQMGVPWDHTLGDEEWMEHVRQTKPRNPTRTTTSVEELRNE